MSRCKVLNYEGELWDVKCALVLQNVPSEDDPEVRNHGEGPY